jgi:predicted ATPase/DNA-binding CsgD family transcriptional regulator
MDTQSPHNLPEQPNAILGRDLELRAAREQLLSDDVRLLSLTGPPGVGKTRLAMAVAESVLEAFPQGVWFIDLAPLKDPALVASQIASIFGIVEIRAETALDSLIAYLRDRRVLLFLDNFEGVLPAAAWVGKLLERTHGVKILTTSRERLRLRWERTILVPPLPLPDLAQAPMPSYLADFPSVALFVQRATAVNAAFLFSMENAPIIAVLCHRLDGLPLAIELAAARASVLTPAEILANMDDRFRLLGMGALDLPERHQSLQASIDLSYESLLPAEGKFLCQLSVFSGGFSRAAAGIVGDCEALGLDGLQTLIDLVEKGLVNTIRGPGSETRFTLFESIREYLLDRLQASGGLDGARRRHAGYFLELAERTYTDKKKRDQKARFDLLESEHGNLRAALQWSLDTGELDIGKRIAAASWNFWWLRGAILEGVRWLETFLGSDRESGDETHMLALEGLGLLRGWQGDYEPGKALLMDAIQIAQERSDQEAIVRVLAWLCWISWMNGKTEEAAWLADRMKACSPNVDPWDLAYAYLSLGCLQFEAGLDEAAGNAFTRSIEYFDLAEGRQGAISAASRLTLIKYKQGDLQEATQGMVEALEAARQSIDLYVIAYCMDDAALLATQLLDQHRAGSNGTRGGDLEKIALILGAVDHWREIRSLPRTPRDHAAYLQITEMLRSQLGEPTYLRAWQNGQALTVEKVVGEAIALLETTWLPGPMDRRSPEREGTSIMLSERERQVIGLVAEGLSNQEIGERLFITERTVRFHTTSIFNKLGADNRAQAVAIANRLDML